MKSIQKNRQLTFLIRELKKAAATNEVALWKRVASDLEKPTRRQRMVNIYKIDQHARDKETILVPGKVLGVGELSKNVNVAAYNFSLSAYEKISQKGKAISIIELLKQNPKGKNVRILG